MDTLDCSTAGQHRELFLSKIYTDDDLGRFVRDIREYLDLSGFEFYNMINQGRTLDMLKSRVAKSKVVVTELRKPNAKHKA